MKAFFGVPVYTMDENQSVQETLVVEGDRVRFVGRRDEAIRSYPNAEPVELANGCIFPGFIDAHLHLREFSLLFRDVDLSAIRRRDEFLDRVRDAASGKTEGDWMIGGGANPSIIRGMSKSDLDSICPEIPLVIYSWDMHTILVNSATLTECHIDTSRQDPLGGRIDRDTSGKPIGILRERAVELVKRHMPEEKTKTVQSAIAQGIDKLVARGVTTFCDCSVYNTDLLMHTLMRLYSQEKLKVRAVLMFGDRYAVRLGSMGMQSLFGNEKVKIGGCKLILDGSLSSRSAFMRRPYIGGESSGMLLMEESELHQILKRSYADYLWTGVHAIGNRAVEIALRVYEKLGKEVGIPKLLKRIEHAQSINDEDIEKFSSVGVIPVVNPVHIPYDRKSALAYLGPDARLQHRLGSLVATGATLAIGSDAPVGSINPFHGIYAAVERKDFDEGPELRFFPKERIGLRDALAAYTRGSAAALGLESGIGSLEPGKYADFVVLSHDILNMDVETLGNVKVRLTYVGGEIVYEGEND